MNSASRYRIAGRRAIAALSSVAMLATAVHAAPVAFAAKPDTSVTGSAPKGGNDGRGQGTVTVTTEVTQGGTLEVTLTGFAPREGGQLALKINDGAIAVPAEQGENGLTVEDGAAIILGDRLPDASGTTTVPLTIPADLAPGDYWVRVLGGNDGGEGVSKVGWFTVTEKTDSSDSSDSTGSNGSADSGNPGNSGTESVGEGEKGVVSAAGVSPRTSSHSGAGELTVVNADDTVTAGGILTIKGTGFADRQAAGADAGLAVKLLDGPTRNSYGYKLGQNQEGADVTDVDGAGTGQLTGSHLPGPSGDFEFTVRIPTNLKDGWYWIRVLGGPDNGGAVSKFVWFKVTGGTGSDTAAAPVVEAPQGGFTSTWNGAVMYPVTVTGLQPNQVVTATVDDTPATFRAGHGPTSPTATADADGTLRTVLVVAPDEVAQGKALAFTGHTLFFYAEGNTTTPIAQARPDAGTTPAVKVANPDYPKVTNTSIGSDAKVTITNLPDGVTVSWLGTDETNLIGSDRTVGADYSTTFDITIPNDGALIGKKLQVTYSNGNRSHTYVTDLTFTANNDTFNTDKVEVHKAELVKGLYQSVYSPKQNALYVSSAGRNKDRSPFGQLLKVNPETFAIETTIDTANARVFGVGIDKERDRIWGTETIKNRVVAYDKDLGEEFITPDAPDQLIRHARVPVVDETTGIAYVSSPITHEENIAKVDPRTQQVTRVATPGFADPMGMDFDQKTGTLYTVSLDSPKLMALNVRTGGAPTVWTVSDEQLESGSDVAWDPDTHTLWAVGQHSANAIAIDTTTGQVVANIPTGDGALGIAYEPVHKKIFVANRVGGTVTVIDAVTRQKVANIGVGMYPNNVSVDGKGNVFVVNKISGADDTKAADDIYRLTWKADQTVTPTEKPGENPGENPGEKPADKPAEKPGDKPGDTDGSSDNPALLGVAGIGAILAILGVIYQALVSGIIPATMLPPQLREALHLK